MHISTLPLSSSQLYEPFSLYYFFFFFLNFTSTPYIYLFSLPSSFFFFLNDPAPTEISPLSLHAPLPIYQRSPHAAPADHPHQHLRRREPPGGAGARRDVPVAQVGFDRRALSLLGWPPGGSRRRRCW